MLQRAHECHKQYLKKLGLSSDDDQGCIPIVTGYMDDIDAIVHIEDAAFFIHQFKRLGLPLGAVLNQEKTRVMTYTNGHKLTDLLKTSDDPHLRAMGDKLSPMIHTYARIQPKMACHMRLLTASAFWGPQ